MIIRHDGKRLWVSKDEGNRNIRNDFKVLSWNNRERRVHGRNKELRRGTGFVGEMMSSVRDC